MPKKKDGEANCRQPTLWTCAPSNARLVKLECGHKISRSVGWWLRLSDRLGERSEQAIFELPVSCTELPFSPPFGRFGTSLWTIGGLRGKVHSGKGLSRRYGALLIG
jgi:hypothetical protein